ncbi:MAG: EAL domain-containing protein [Vicinamibacteria bacterium]
MSAGRVLVVDDDPEVGFVVGEVLRNAGFEAEVAASGSEALARLRGERLDAIVSDISMPGCDGLQLLRGVREADLDLPVILITGRPSMPSAITALELGALRYLLKPVAALELTEAVEAAVRLGRLARWKRQALAHLGETRRLMGDRASAEAAFAGALATLWMAYQPILRAADSSLFGHEALVRSDSRALGDPGALFDVAERLDRVRVLGRAVRGAVAAGAPPGRVFVNLHADDLTDEALFAAETALAGRAGGVVLEITERAALDRVPDLQARVRRLRALGYRIAVDDLGAGYADLNSFAALEPDLVKLDMALVRGLDRDAIKRTLVRTLVELCRELRIPIVAEGVETEPERGVLVELGCDLLQGFLLGRPERWPRP